MSYLSGVVSIVVSMTSSDSCFLGFFLRFFLFLGYGVSEAGLFDFSISACFGSWSDWSCFWSSYGSTFPLSCSSSLAILLWYRTSSLLFASNTCFNESSSALHESFSARKLAIIYPDWESCIFSVSLLSSRPTWAATAPQPFSVSILPELLGEFTMVATMSWGWFI